MNKVLLIVFCLLCAFHLPLQGKLPLHYILPTYDIVCAGTGIEGSYLTKVSVYSSKPDKEVEINLIKAAVHGVIFKGLGSTTDCKGQRALVTDPEAEKTYADFFESFFTTPTQFSLYASLVEGTLKVTKIKKKLYRLSAVVSVEKDRLRQLLEQRKISKGFQDLF